MIFHRLPAWKAYLAVAALAAFFMSGAYTKGRMDGHDLARAETLQATIDQLKERGETDAEIEKMDRAALCRALGGMPDGDDCR